ncbi:universal stress protein, partial [Parabacteroides sp. OttesenSCG-928-K15]|nr:universal stress protein [Parabacteroides sp. OttesenSCG-928-K15]
ATSFNQRDLVMFDRFMDLIKGFNFHIHLFNVSTSKDEWNEIRLTGVKEYFKQQYPDKNITHSVLADGDLLLAVEKFVRENQIELIAISTQRRNILARMFNPSIARKMLFHTDTPLLVMHT